jgi:hypothetical protein
MAGLFPGVTRLHLLVALFALVLYLPGFWWGAPNATSAELVHSWGTDDETPLGPLAEMHNIIEPKADRNLGYPLMYSFIVSAAYIPYLGVLWLTGDLSGVSGHYPFGLSDPVTALKVMSGIAHFVTVLMAMGVVVSVFEAARVLWGNHAGITAALLTATTYPMFYYSRTGNVDVPMLFFIAASMAVFAHCLANGFTVRRSVWLGVLAGFALATKESALGIYILMPFVFFWWQRKQDNDMFSRSYWKAPVAAIVAAFAALGAGSGLFVDPSRYFDHMRFITGRLEQVASDAVHAVITAFPYTMTGNLEYISHILDHLVDMMTLPGFLLCISALVLALWKCRRCTVLPLLGLGYLVFIFLVVRSTQMRYLLPVPMALSFASAWLVFYFWHPKHVLRRTGIVFVVGAIVAYSLLRGVALSYEMMNDSRLAAGQWLSANTSDGDIIEYFGPADKLPPVEEGIIIHRATEYQGMHAHHRDDDERIREIIQGWAARKPKYIVIMPDHASRQGQPFNISCPEQLCNFMIEGRSVFRQEMMFKTPPLFHWLELPPLDYPVVNPPIRIYSYPENNNQNPEWVFWAGRHPKINLDG